MSNITLRKKQRKIRSRCFASTLESIADCPDTSSHHSSDDGQVGVSSSQESLESMDSDVSLGSASTKRRSSSGTTATTGSCSLESLDNMYAAVNSSHESSSTSSSDIKIHPTISYSLSASEADSPSTLHTAVSHGSLTRNDLIAAVDDLSSKLIKAKFDIAAEKAARKQKERRLIKLAQELSRRTESSKRKEARISKLALDCRYMEERLAYAEEQLKMQDSTVAQMEQGFHRELSISHERLRSVGSEYDQQIAEISAEHKRKIEELKATALKQERQHHREMTMAQQKYRNMCRESDARLADITANSDHQVKQLRQELLASKAEIDRLRSKLAVANMRGPHIVGDIPGPGVSNFQITSKLVFASAFLVGICAACYQVFGPFSEWGRW